MPKRNNTSLSQYSRDSKRKRQSRSQETQEEHDLRLARRREHYAESLSLDTATQRERRLADDRDRIAVSRASETVNQLETRLAVDRERHVLSRQSETFTHREERLTQERNQHATNEVTETEEDHLSRLELARDHCQQAIQDHDDFLSTERERVDDIRQSETETPREARIFHDRMRHSLNRMSSSSEEEDVLYQAVPNESLIWANKLRSGFSYSPSIDYATYANVGHMDVCCNFCNALKWRKESIGLCCSGGKIYINMFEDPPELLRSLLNGDHQNSNHFLAHIRQYNSAFQMTSFGAKKLSERHFMPTFKVQGQIYHLIGSLLANNDPKFLQIYFVSDYNEQVSIRNQNFPSLNSNVVSQLQLMLHEVNPYVTSFKSALETFTPGQSANYKFVISADRRPPTEHRGRYNAPTANEVAVVLIDQQCDKRDIVLRTRDNRLQRIAETHRAYDALQYPLIFCRGEDGYNFLLHQIDPATRQPNYNKKMSSLQFYSYLLQVRLNRFEYLQRFRGLFSQFIVDMYAEIETERLVYVRTNQRKLRAEKYVDLRDAMQHDNNVENLGRLVILPSSFTGSPRYMHERTQDAFCYVRKYGRPDLFVTFTTNPKWEEISRELLPGQVSYDRHDIVARIFHLKLKLMISLLTKERVFGEALCFMYSVEWQKRGLPHAHILLWLVDKIRPNDVDNIISAEFPNPVDDQILHNNIKKHMVHGPCGALNTKSPCMQNGQCSKRYPKAMIQQTVTGENGYPTYRRRSQQQGGFAAEIRLRGQQPMIVDNRWVVPYSPVLSKTFNAHINVEMCNSVESIKYICKYVNKGSDQATIALQNERDEITRFQSGRYISSSEAVWRILSFPINERHPPVMHLAVHLEGGQRIYFDPENIIERLENPRQTTLLAFFQLCNTDNFAKTLLYDETPAYFTYSKQQGRFNRRKRGTAVEGVPGVYKEHVLGRVYTVHPSNAECYCLRLLLHTVRGPTSFEALKKVDETQHLTFQAACRARLLLDDDQHWDDALNEACISDSPRRLRHLFSVMLVFCALSDAAQLWQKYQNNLAEDYIHDISRNISISEMNNQQREMIYNRCLNEIQDMVLSIGGNALSYYGLPEAISNEERGNQEYSSESNYDSTELLNTLRDNIPSLTDEQRSIFHRVCNSANNSLGEILFLDAPGGTGKTFLTKVILAKLRHEGKIALAVASSGIAATLLPGGKTAHATFKIPLQLELIEQTVCDVSRNSNKARLLRDCHLIVWDECTMAHRKAVEAVDRMLRDIRQSDQAMGGITVLFCGDFRQTLPVVPRGTRTDEINACLKSSTLWPHIIKLQLTVNMRVRTGGNQNVKEFSDLLLKIGDGRYPKEQGLITLSDDVCEVVTSLERLILSVYENLSNITTRQDSWLCERAILSPRNQEVMEINNIIMEQVEGLQVEYTSINSVVDQGEASTYPVEFLNSLSAPGLPAHIIKLKVGVPIILLRNLSPPKLCNGTRLKVISLQRNVIEAQILTGCGAGERVFIPRIPLIPNNYPFRFKRVQFPISVSFCMTINKAQGQTMSRVGVDLRKPCFSHGQLYVALSRVSSAKSLSILTDVNKKTNNIVYEEIL